MASLYKEYKKLTNKYGSNSNFNSFSDYFIPPIKMKPIIPTSRKIVYQRNRENNLDFFILDNMNETEQAKQNTYYTILNKGNSSSNLRSFNTLENNKNANSNHKSIKMKFKARKYNNYYLASNLLKHRYISDLIQDKEYQEPMKHADDKIDNMIKYLKIQQNFKADKTNKLSYSTTQRFILYNKKYKLNTTNINNKETTKSNRTNLTNKKIGANSLSPDQKQSKDLYLFKKIFFYADKKKSKPDKGLDNKYNIIYSENENQYRQKLNKLNEIYKAMGKKTYNIDSTQSENKVKNLQKRVDFMKRIVDYTYPNMVLTKIKEQDRTIYVKSGVSVNIISSKINRKIHSKYNDKISQGLVQSLSVRKCIFKGFEKMKRIKK